MRYITINVFLYLLLLNCAYFLLWYIRKINKLCSGSKLCMKTYVARILMGRHGVYVTNFCSE